MVLDEQQHLRQILMDHFIRMSQKNPRFSIRSFARKLGVSSSSLSEILRGKRKVSSKKALQFADKLNLPTKEVKKLESLFSKKSSIESLSKMSNPFREVILKPHEFDLLADWRFFAIVALMRTKGFQSNENWIAKRLALSGSEVAIAIQRMIELDIIQRDSGGTLTEQKCSFRTSEDYPDKLIRDRQIQGLTAAIQSIQSKIQGQVGCYSTISADPKNLEKASEMMEEFLKKLSFFIHDGEPSEVFELHIQLFPRTTPNILLKN